RRAAPAHREDQAGRGRKDPPRGAVHRQGLLRPLRGAREARHRRHLPPARRATLSVPGQGADDRAVALQAGRDRVVPGGAAQHGRMVLRRHLCRLDRAPDRRQAPRPTLRRPPRLGCDRHRPDAEAHGAAQAVPRRGAGITERARIMTEIRVPTLGESVTEATIGKWFKKPGDPVAVDEPLVELETDKVTIEVPAPAAGTLSAIAAKDGDTVAVGALLGEIKEGAGAAPGKASPAPAGRPDQKT